MRAFDASLDLLDHAVAAAFGIGRTDLRAMELISRSGSASCGELASALRLTTGSVTALVDRMERLGYLRRARASPDRRKVLVALTPKGKQRERETFAPLQRDTLRALSRYDEKQLTLITDFIDTVQTAVDEARRRIVQRRHTKKKEAS
jgi:DNA-binding MarR family transcriptional regulator